MKVTDSLVDGHEAVWNLLLSKPGNISLDTIQPHRDVPQGRSKLERLIHINTCISY
jgi:hypothetical protein